jgi:hypothetical protein
MQIRESQIVPNLSELDMSGKDKENGRYTWEKKYSVVSTYIACGNMRLTAKKCGVNAQTIENWRKTSWWDDIVSELQNTESAELKNKLNKLTKKALDMIEDQLETGETVLNQKTGELMKKPVAFRDVARVASDLMIRQNELKKNQFEQEVGKATTQEILKSLAAEFANFNKNKSSPAEDIEFVEIVPDE